MALQNLGRLIASIDDWVRFQDLAWHRTAGGFLARFGLDRHSPGAILFPSLLSGVLLLAAPVFNLRLLAACLLSALSAFLLLRLTAASSRARRPLWFDLAIQLALLSAVSAALWLAGADTFQPAAPYRHLWIPLTALTILSLAAAALLAHFLFRRFLDPAANLYPSYLARTELFLSRGPSRPVTPSTILLALLTVPLRAPLQLLLPPALVALFCPPLFLVPATVAAAAVSLIALFFSGLNDRLSTMWILLQSGFFRGFASLVSLAVIALAAARLNNVSYVKTVLDTAAGQTIAFLVIAAYLLTWWYDYWTSRLLAQQLLALLQPSTSAQPSIDYPILPAAQATSVPTAHRSIQIHGSSRFLIIRPPQPGDPETFPTYHGRRVPHFQAHSLSTVISLLASTGAPGGKARPHPDPILDRITLYRRSVATVLALAAIAAGLAINRGPQLPQAVATSSTRGAATLSQLLYDPQRLASGRPAILLAASGGGTRAALYTAAVLEAIHLRHGSDSVVLASGVSGGGAALAYFAGARPQLIQPGETPAWQRFFDVMQQPFIQDVLTRSSEWRIISAGRLGLLLDESFRERWQLPAHRNTLGQVPDFGLILNTALTGSFDKRGLSLPLLEAERQYRKAWSSSQLAGARLILTNLKLAHSLTGPLPEGPSQEPLPVVVNHSNVRLETAAALNANFPPVFANAAVDVEDQRRYWVTDGGAVDNRGMEMMLYALRQSLQSQPQSSPLPKVKVVVADASGYTPGFSQDRGLSAASSAGAQFASQLASELIASIQSIYAAHHQPADFAFHYLMMPDQLRASDSFGTHWMLQPRIRISSPSGSSVTLTGPETIALIRSLYRPTPLPLTPNTQSAQKLVAQKMGTVTNFPF